MKEDKEKWIGEVFDSMKGSKRAKPSPELFVRIENQFNPEENKVIQLFSSKIAAAAAIVLLALNVFVLSQYARSASLHTGSIVLESTIEPLISDYKIYE